MNEDIRLLIVGAASGISVYAATLSTLAARTARRNPARDPVNARRPHGETP